MGTSGLGPIVFGFLFLGCKLSAMAVGGVFGVFVVSHFAYEWWCESINISEWRDEAGYVFGSTKQMCLIDDCYVDLYMAYLDFRHIVMFLTSVAQKLGIEWRLDFVGKPFGVVTRTGPDAGVRQMIMALLEFDAENFEPLRMRYRHDLLAEWPDR